MCLKICSYFMTVFILLFYNISYAEPVQINIVQDITLNPGNTVIIPIKISNFSDANIRGYALRLNYDEKIFQNPVLVDTNTLCAGKEIKQLLPKDGIGKYSVSMFEKFEAKENDVLIKIQFTIANNYTAGKPFISFVSPNKKTTLFNNDFEQIDTVFTPSTGDINNDGIINLSDAVSVLKILIEDYSGNTELGADFDFDRKIGISEAIYILQYIAGNL